MTIEPLTPAAAKIFLLAAANYFERRDIGGEDMAYWANVCNAQNCRKIIALIDNLAALGKEPA